jgi:hypothetical protein
MKLIFSLLLLILFSGCEFQMKDSEVERLRIEQQAAASEQTAAMMKDQAATFERVIIAQNQVLSAAIGNRHDILPYILMMIACVGIGIGALLVALFVLKDRRPAQPMIYVINPDDVYQIGADRRLIELKGGVI